MKAVLSITALLATCLALTACGGDDDNEYNTNASNEDEIRLSQVGGSYYSTRGAEYAERQDIVLRNGQIQSTVKNIAGENTDTDETSTYEYIAPNYYFTFEGTDMAFDALISPTINILSPLSYQTTLYSNNDDVALTITHTLKEYDISSVTAKDEDRFYTPLSTYRLNEAQFPEGSTCYAHVNEKPSFPVFELGSAYLNETTLDQALSMLEEDAEYEVLEVGESNEYKAYYMTNADEDSYNAYQSAVEIDGQLYSADYVTEGYTRNTNPDIDTVECTLFNEIAADYIETQISERGYLAEPTTYLN